jgi:hypothetical protein
VLVVIVFGYTGIRPTKTPLICEFDMIENVLAIRYGDRSLTGRTVMLKILDEILQKYSQMYNIALNKDYEH